MTKIYDNQTILITGGTGSLGKAFLKRIFKNSNPKKVIVFSRDEMKQWELAKIYDDERLRFFIGDVRDAQRLKTAFDGVDLIIHAAASKIVPIAEYNPFECVKTNVLGAMNVIDCAIEKSVKKVVALSTDKASSPINLYGATKLTSDKMFIAGNNYASSRDTRFAVVRYGNVVGSRGSFIPFLNSLNHDQKVPITDSRMTRFMITLDQGLDLIDTAFKEMIGGEIFVKKIPSISIMEIVKYLRPNARIDLVGIRPGEKIHEQMISVEDAPTTYSYDDYFKILPVINDWCNDPRRIADGKRVAPDFFYTSDNNPQWLTKEAFLHMLQYEGLLV